ncbi:MAG: 50S ribosomal protein L23 [Pseudomonadales bacterium]|jgi:large subunit ribosomal protein L23|nr:50S ribosomal protein L23 [Pseudomonadales bacterium]MDP4639908.1 50S ribosomal protein L23 [Pseudomonadales bacterium]MDP4765152.1 50S ribosomal protein L23 [Pseudomonadales bacterium]MDP4874764.1 50S ribosomal protein L23 [Pseudomonadales bacterium]MDP4910600.1 50S ribosomal protein L23 [Pseudomonadales bacterium]
MNEERMYQILLGAHISEKATVIAEAANQFTFKVTKDATRPEIKAAVEKIYGVVVQGVTTLNVKGKVKRTARGVSKKASWKKAYVRLAEGHEIDFAS